VLKLVQDVKINDQPTFDEHIKAIFFKVSRQLNAFIQIQSNMNQQQLNMKVRQTLILPHSVYVELLFQQKLIENGNDYKIVLVFCISNSKLNYSELLLDLVDAITISYCSHEWIHCPKTQRLLKVVPISRN
jgi:hypothetical protein